ncbi:phosphatidylcholine/phosphatidylserine synthase, partial [Pseudomonas syringae pv. tagetis]
LPDFTVLLIDSVFVVSSVFLLCIVDMYRKYNYFQGFPAGWNVVALCLYIVWPAPWLTFFTIIGLGLLTLSGLMFLLPFGVR